VYYIIHPDGTKATFKDWSAVEPLFDRYNIEGAASLKRSLSPEAVAVAAKEDGGGTWQDNEFDERDADGAYTGRCLAIEGDDTPEA
jgi:hypothetical protein